MSKITNKGSGAGGSNTNKNGLPYEKITDLQTEYNIIETHNNHNIIQFGQNNLKFKVTKQSGLFQSMKYVIDKDIKKAHGCKNPDECFIYENKKIIFILEKKFQQTSGSVCEKIQTSDFKLWQYDRTFPDYKIVYMYCLSDWFKINCNAELEYLEYKNVPVFWGNCPNYKKNIIDYIINYTNNYKAPSYPLI